MDEIRTNVVEEAGRQAYCRSMGKARMDNVEATQRENIAWFCLYDVSF